MRLYQREYDLRKYNKSLLRKYNLQPKRYVYIGATTKPVYERNTKWKYAILNNLYCVSKEIKEFIHNLRSFYKYELDMLNDEIDRLLFFTYEVIAETNDFNLLRELEQVTNASYLMMEFMQKDIILLSKHDTKIKIDNDKVILKNNNKIKINREKNVIISKKLKNKQEKNTPSLVAKSVS